MSGSERFYESLSAYYDGLFPLDLEILDFLERNLPSRGTVLDAACGTGTYSLALADNGVNIIGIDLDDGMIRTAEERRRKSSVSPEKARFVRSDMGELDSAIGEPLSAVFCIGNSIVHLPDTKRVATFLRSAAGNMIRGAILIIQTVNFDRILDRNVTSLPTLEGEGIRMTRGYEKAADGTHLLFKTVLTIGSEMSEQRTVENSVPLIALRKSNLERLAADAGFTDIRAFGSYSGEPWGEESFLTILTARRAG